jgi:hypothetical protein
MEDMKVNLYRFTDLFFWWDTKMYIVPPTAAFPRFTAAVER